MSETPRTDELKRGIWRLMQSQEREQAYAWRDAIHCGIEQLERELAAERERADRNHEDAERYRWLKDGVWDDRLTRIIELRMNAIWDAAIDAARRK